MGLVGLEHWSDGLDLRPVYSPHGHSLILVSARDQFYRYVHLMT